MPLFECEKCGTVDNTALTNFWMAQRDDKPKLCSECDPEIGKWHGRFPRMTRAEHDSKSERKVEFPARVAPEQGGSK
jgi:hypothetical protein